MIKYNKKTRQVRENINKRKDVTNIKFVGYYAMKVNESIITNSINEAIRILDARKSENEYTRKNIRAKLIL